MLSVLEAAGPRTWLRAAVTSAACAPALRQSSRAHGGHAHGGRGQVAPPVSIPGIKAIVAVASGKGGVGKSTTAVNIAIALSALKLKIGILDADVYGPSIPKMMNVEAEKPTTNEDKKIVPIENYGIKCMSMGFLVSKEEAMVWRGPMVMSALDQMLHKVAWGELDVLIVDMPPGTGDAQLTITQKAPLTGAVIVTTPQDIALLDARRGVTMFRKVGVPILGLVENMSVFVCPNCSTHTHIFGKDGAHAAAAEIGTTVIGSIPLKLDIRERADDGHPVALESANGELSPSAQVYRDIALKVRESIASTQAGSSQTTITME